MYVRYILSNILFQVNSLINIYLILLLMVSKNVGIKLLNLYILPKKGGGVVAREWCVLADLVRQ